MQDVKSVFPHFTLFRKNSDVLAERSFPGSVRRTDPGSDPCIVMKALEIVLAGCPKGYLQSFTLFFFAWDLCRCINIGLQVIGIHGAWRRIPH